MYIQYTHRDTHVFIYLYLYKYTHIMIMNPDSLNYFVGFPSQNAAGSF